MSREDAAPTAPTRTRYGTANPEWVENELWERAVLEEWTGYGLRKHLGLGFDSSQSCRDYSHSYRDTSPGPFWSWERFGRTSTALPDGRVIHIAGEHEDAYDPDFCIYNDVVVEYPGGRREFYLYPKDVFPPTDFHSATLVGHEIILIGSLGYRDLRRIGETQVLKLDTRTLRIHPVPTAGEGPGWLSRHTAEKLGETRILVIGGKIMTAHDYEPNTGMFELDLASMTWRRREHGDTALFAIGEAVYRKSKAPRYGMANPERSDNPFWLEMARRRWPPSRARLHYGDFAPPEPKPVVSEDASGRLEFPKLARTIDDVVWTAVRDSAVQVKLADGRSLQIGGQILDYGAEYADPWNYNDIVVTGTDGLIEILTYPVVVFPHLSWWRVDAVIFENVYIFGSVDGQCHPDQPRGPMVLLLDTSTYALTPIQVPAPPWPVNVYPGSGVRDGTRAVFPVARDLNSDPELGIPFDLVALNWGEPFRWTHPVDD